MDNILKEEIEFFQSLTDDELAIYTLALEEGIDDELSSVQDERD